MYTHTTIHTSQHTYHHNHTHIYTYKHKYKHTCMHTYIIHTTIHTYVQPHIYTQQYIHIHTQAYIRTFFWHMISVTRHKTHVHLAHTDTPVTCIRQQGASRTAHTRGCTCMPLPTDNTGQDCIDRHRGQQNTCVLRQAHDTSDAISSKPVLCRFSSFLMMAYSSGSASDRGWKFKGNGEDCVFTHTHHVCVCVAVCVRESVCV